MCGCMAKDILKILPLGFKQNPRFHKQTTANIAFDQNQQKAEKTHRSREKNRFNFKRSAHAQVFGKLCGGFQTALMAFTVRQKYLASSERDAK